MLQSFLKRFVISTSDVEDVQRKEFILNVLLLSSMTLFGAATSASLILLFLDTRSEDNFVSAAILGLITLVFLGLFRLSRQGKSRISAYVLVGVFVVFAAWMGARWSVDLQSSLLIYALTIVMAGVLINTRTAFVLTGLVAIAIALTAHLHDVGAVVPDYDWRTEDWKMSDTVMTGIIFLVIATVSWLSNREIERSLRRARRSEADLRHERDQLEVVVEERTRELKQSQMERIAELYRFAEFGRLSSGLFHDLMNPLSAVSINVERARGQSGTVGDLSTATAYLDQATTAARRMERFIVAVRKQIGKEPQRSRFGLAEEARQVLDILSYKAVIAGVELKFDADAECMLEGDPVRWSQVLLNLVTNAIDSYDDCPGAQTRRVVIALTDVGDGYRCTISDQGCGIMPEHLVRIFDPFFSTKAGHETKGTGIGLSIVKSIIEKDFGGTITVTSSPSAGTVFSILLPQ